MKSQTGLIFGTDVQRDRLEIRTSTDIKELEDFELSEKRAASYEAKIVEVCFKQLNEFTAIEITVWAKMYRTFTSLYLKLYSQYRHMWE